MNRLKTLAFSILFALACVTGASATNTISFPVPSGVPQVKGGFKNEAGVVVTKVKVNQQSSNGCEQIDKSNDGNLSDGNGFYVEYNPMCDYEFHIEVSSCPNKEQHVSSSDIQSGQTEVVLKGSCLNLETSREVP